MVVVVRRAPPRRATTTPKELFVDLVRAISRMHISPTFMLVENSLWPADDPLVLAHPTWFTADLEPILNRSAPAPQSRKVRTTATQPLVEAR